MPEVMEVAVGNGAGAYMGAGGARWRIKFSGFKGLTDVLSVLNSTESARIGHGNSAGAYLGTEDTRQPTPDAERLSDPVDELNGARDCTDELSKHRNVHSVANELKTRW